MSPDEGRVKRDEVPKVQYFRSRGDRLLFNFLFLFLGGVVVWVGYEYWGFFR